MRNNLILQPGIEQIQVEVKREFDQPEPVKDSIKNQEGENGALLAGLLRVNPRHSVINRQSS